ncbi:unnamed protein product, partial [Didymodactylos carnosus]
KLAFIKHVAQQFCVDEMKHVLTTNDFKFEGA